ncbi:MAG: hypothetical protein SOZ23_04535 [Methanosphaera sp.]|uniref:hypothetical protein n=1 Tax=Methanosphaera sp. TaxID=2666342 RepID=UPI0025CEEA96|nr:hypothetical protein [Methanosphaera sp.]MCI5867680.1 hypothetical protein [Methanosphaera sp.]MDD6534148.1 hypothetical protein [Methanosphaera sp.]MDY3956043.1 hypothetical protein [Methanosphaera sp.]
MNNKGQITIEYILILSIICICMIMTTQIVDEQIEQNIIQHAAQNGAQNGLDKNTYATYYNDTYNNYYENHKRLLLSNKVEIIKIQQIKKQDTIQIQVYAHTNTLNNEEKHILSSRINYYIRASITKTFNKTSNTFYEPAYSKNYKITTRNIIWI